MCACARRSAPPVASLSASQPHQCWSCAQGLASGPFQTAVLRLARAVATQATGAQIDRGVAAQEIGVQIEQQKAKLAQLAQRMEFERCAEVRDHIKELEVSCGWIHPSALRCVGACERRARP